MNLIGISEEDLATIIEEAARRGYAQGRKEAEDDEWLNGREAICRFINPEKPMAPSTFRDNRRAGRFGEAIIGRGDNCKARKSDLLDAMRRYELSRL